MKPMLSLFEPHLVVLSVSIFVSVAFALSLPLPLSTNSLSPTFVYQKKFLSLCLCHTATFYSLTITWD
jgi:hypothetical protein